jgi:hypothetical protein
MWIDYTRKRVGALRIRFTSKNTRLNETTSNATIFDLSFHFLLSLCAVAKGHLIGMHKFGGRDLA